MRWKIACLSFATALLLAGCNLFPGVFKQTGYDKNVPPPEKPPPGVLIEHLNNNSNMIASIRVEDLDLTARRRLLTFGVNGKLVCQKPRNFRLEAYGPTRSLEADVGSNSN